jgi:hypothetical protein
MAGMKHSSVSSRRARSNPAQRAEWAQRFFQSGVSPREFATRHGLRLATLQRWLKLNPPATPPPAFAELKWPALPPRWAAEVVRADGTVLRLAHDAPAAWLQHLWPTC